MYVFDGLTKNHAEHFQDGKVRKIDFTSSLRMVSGGEFITLLL